jgi:hypothetical protein
MKTHPLIIRIGLVLTIVAGLTAVGLNVTLVRQKIITLRYNLAVQTVAREKAEAGLVATRGELATATAQLKETRTALAASLEAQDQATRTAAIQTKRAEQLGADLAALRRQYEDAAATLARYRAAGLEPEQIVYAAGQIKSLTKDLAAARDQNKTLELRLRLARNDGLSDVVLLPPDLKARVTAADPKWHFIVLNAGENKGVVENGELLVSRAGKLIAKAKISRVEPECSIANLQPGWTLNEVLEGDEAIPAPVTLSSALTALK